MFIRTHRGQAPAKGILATEQRTPERTEFDSLGRPRVVTDPRGYWAGQHTAPHKTEWRQLKRRIGARQAIKQRKVARRAARFEVQA